MNKTRLREYARLIAGVGAGVLPGQEVFISAQLDQPEFITMVAQECYRRGAAKVTVDFEYEPLTKLSYQRRSAESLAAVPDYERERWRYYSEVLPCRIYILSEDPDALAGADQAKISAAQQRRYSVIKPFRDAMENRYQWCIAAVPGRAWAKKVFPELRASRAVERLWQSILDCCRVNGDAQKAWREHNAALKARCAYLNSLGIDALHYTSAAGTDLTVGMIREGRFCSGSESTLSGAVFNPNLPTEECFVSPMRGKAEGIVYATRPLCYNGELIENFRIRFENGRAAEWHAQKNERLLTELINMDGGSAYLGECALVPHSSPIRRSGVLFYNTLFDENAACHLALGEGFADTIDGYKTRTLAECRALGVNESMVHEDFMIGDGTLDIDALCRDGRTVPVFRGGEWAFSI